MMDAKVRDYPDLIKRSGSIVNTNHDDYLRAKSRIKQQKRLDRLENEMSSLHAKLDLLLSMVK